MQNTHNVQKFYDDVFEDFKNRLFIAYRFKSTISSEQIDKFSKIVKDKLHRKREIFETGIRLSLEKRTPESKEFPVSGVSGNGSISKVKLQHQQEEGNYYRSTVKQTIPQNQHQSSSSSSSQDDDLKEFKKDKELHVEQVKKQEPQEKQQADADNDSEEMYEEEDRRKEEILSKSGRKISAHIIASYGTKNKKHIPKVEKTKIDLENVFIRTGDKELFYAKIQCDFEQAKYHEIKL